MVLLMSSGALLALSVCAALGKCRPEEEEDKPGSPPPEESEDRPPSYRLSWRRSFMRRLRIRSDDSEDGIDAEEGRGGVAGVAGGGEASATTPGGGRRGWLGRGKRGGGGGGDGGGGGGRGRSGSGGALLAPTISSFPNSDSSSSLGSLLAVVEASGRRGSEGGLECTSWASTRHTQSLSNLLDPPPYQEAIANMDEASIRKLRSEMCLPSAIQ